MAAPTINQFLSLFMAIQAVCPLTQNLAMVSRTPWLWAYGLTDSDSFCLVLVHRRVEPAGSRRDAALSAVPPGRRRLQPGFLHRQQAPLGTFVLLLGCQRWSWSLSGSTDVAFVFDSQISYAPLWAIRWLTSAPASLPSTSCTSVLGPSPIRPSGRSTAALGEPASPPPPVAQRRATSPRGL